MELYAAMAGSDKYGNSNFRLTIASREIERIIRAKTRIDLEDSDLSALSRIVPDNPTYSYLASSIVTREINEALSERLWKSPINHIDAMLAPRSLYDVIVLYRFLDRNRLFPTNAERSALGNVVLQKIKQAAPEQKLQACEKLLLRTAGEHQYSSADSYVTANLSLRDEILKVWQVELVRHYGLDDGSPGYRALVGKKIDHVLTLSAARDREVILETLADGLLIQSSLAAKIRNDLKPTAETLRETHLPIAGVEALFYELERDANLRLAFIDFLSEPLNKKSLNATAMAVKANKHAVSSLTGIAGITRHDETLILTSAQDQRLESTLQDLHDHFLYLSLEQRSALLSAMLVPGEKRLEEQKYAESYNDSLWLVMDKVFPKKSNNAEDTRSFMYAYLQTAANHERMALLAGMLAVSVDRDPNVPASTAMQAAKIMAALGPAYVKLGQAINSHSECPPDWQQATNGLKSAAKTDPRWTLIEQIEERLPETLRQNITNFGPVLGSASFNTAMQLGWRQANQNTDVVALIERPCAAARAESGFEHLERTVSQWDSPIARNHGATVLEMLAEGRTMAKAETSPEVGEKQYALAQEIYGARQIVVSEDKQKTIININPVNSLASADGLRLVSLASGTHFSDLPENTPEEKSLKHIIAKAYVALEMSNILSGQAFDCDRHGKQLKANLHPNNIIDLNLYDVGGMAITRPTDNQKRALGEALNSVASGIMQGKKPETIIAAAIARTTDVEERQFLMRTRKSWLALGDFMRYLDGKQDYIDILKSVVATGIDPVIKKNMPILSMLSLTRSHAAITIGTQAETFLRQGFVAAKGDLAPPSRVDNRPSDKNIASAVALG
jgi:hypothetical protein